MHTATPLAGHPAARARSRSTWGVLHPEARRGAGSMAVLLIGFLPFGLTVGATIGAHPEPISAWLGTLLIYGGSAHLVVVQLTASGAAIPVAVLTGLLVHARLAVYSLALAPHWGRERRRTRALLAATLIEPTWAMATRRWSEPGTREDRRRHHLAAVAVLTAGWLAMVSVGMAVGPSVMAGTGLHLAAPLCLVTMLVPRAADGAGRAAIAIGAVLGVVAAPLPAGTGMLVAIAGGMAAALAVERVRDAGGVR